MKRSLIYTAVFGVMLMVSGCGGGSSGDSTPEPTTPKPTEPTTPKPTEPTTPKPTEPTTPDPQPTDSEMYTKISSTGEKLPRNAKEWDCILENQTGLMWEHKTDDGGLRDKKHTYSWTGEESQKGVDPANLMIGTVKVSDRFGIIYWTDKDVPYGESCGHTLAMCNTGDYIQAINNKKLCGYSNWRLPAKSELMKAEGRGEDGQGMENNVYRSSELNHFFNDASTAHFAVNFKYFSTWSSSVRRETYSSQTTTTPRVSVWVGDRLVGGKLIVGQPIRLVRSDSACSFDEIRMNGKCAKRYTKIDLVGKKLLDSATEWSCMQDNKTGLMWERKTEDGGLRDYKMDYAWFDGKSGYLDPRDAIIEEYNKWGWASTKKSLSETENQYGYSCANTLAKCNTQDYIKALNAEKLCGYSDWSLPSADDLRGITYADESFEDRLIDFSTTSTENSSNTQYVENVEITLGQGGPRAKPRQKVRAVRGK